jgi:hypothetical protein
LFRAFSAVLHGRKYKGKGETFVRIHTYLVSLTFALNSEMGANCANDCTHSLLFILFTFVNFSELSDAQNFSQNRYLGRIQTFCQDIFFDFEKVKRFLNS